MKKVVLLMLYLVSIASYAVEMEYCPIRKNTGAETRFSCFSSPQACEDYVKNNHDLMCVAKPKG